MNHQLQTEESQPKSQVGLWALAGFLVVVLAVYHLQGGEAEKPDEPVKKQTPPSQETSIPEASVTQADHPAVDWPAISFERLVENNPFQPEKVEAIVLGTAEDQAARQAVEQALEESREVRRRQTELAQELSSSVRQVRLLFQSPRGAAAIIGDRVVHVGDEFDGYQVLKIDGDGVLLKHLDEPATASIESD